MTTRYIADSGVFIRCGGPNNRKYQRLRRAVRQSRVSLHVPRRVHEELGGTSDDEAYPSSAIPWQDGLDDGWIVVADPLEYTNPIVSDVMDASRRFIATETDRPEDTIEKTDTALVGLAAQFLDTETVDHVVLLTTDKPAGRAAETILPEYGFRDRIDYRYVSERYVERVSADDFRV